VAGLVSGFPAVDAGSSTSPQVLRAGKRPSACELGLVAIPVAGGVETQLVPRRRLVDPQVAATMLSTAVVNAVSEELLWRGVFVEHFDDDVVLGAVWPLAGFSLWHAAAHFYFSCSSSSRPHRRSRPSVARAPARSRGVVSVTSTAGKRGARSG
jgi:hypothetical protein